MTKQPHPIVFAGAGPGDPELITIKAMKALGNADLILYAGSLVPEAVLCWKKEKATAVSSAGMDLSTIVETMTAAAESGQRVVRLHTGDPSLYGAIFEQMRALEDRSIPYRIIPGVTAAFAAAASMGMEYTLPEVTQTLILTRMAGRTPVPESEDLEKLAAHGASMAIYLSLSLVENVQAVLCEHYGSESLCAVAYKVSHPEEKIVYTTIGTLDSTCRQEKITRHALILVGEAVAASRGSHDLIVSKLYHAGFSHGYRDSR